MVTIGKVIDLTGKKFNRLSVKKYVGVNKHKKAEWLCKCDCGKEVVVLAAHLKNGNTKSCGCLNDESRRRGTHGSRHTRLYRIWLLIKQRAYYDTKYNYKNYGGRGITMCETWAKDFSSFKKWAMSKGYNDNLTIDRIDNDGDYEPGNCRWVTLADNQNNKRNNILVEWQGETRTLSQWAEMMSVKYGTLITRYRRGDRGERLFRKLERNGKYL